MTVGSGGFNNGFATSITFDDEAARGTSNNRDDPFNALGFNDGSFFEIGFGSFVELTFGTTFSAEAAIFEVTFGNPSNFPESADIFAGNGGNFTFVASLPNVDAQGGAVLSLAGLLGGPFDTIRIEDTSSPIRNALTGGFDIDAVQVTTGPNDNVPIVPLPAALPLMAGGLGLLGLMGWRRKRKAATA